MCYINVKTSCICDNPFYLHSDGWALHYLKHTTIGWQLHCQWKDCSTSWVNLADLKESYPIETAEYAIILGIDHEPAFNWWV
jgi:hypothetical protein